MMLDNKVDISPCVQALDVHSERPASPEGKQREIAGMRHAELQGAGVCADDRVRQKPRLSVSTATKPDRLSRHRHTFAPEIRAQQLAQNAACEHIGLEVAGAPKALRPRLLFPAKLFK